MAEGPCSSVPKTPVRISRRRSLRGGPLIAGLYDLEKTIGQGHFAVVKLARHVFTGEQVAVKVIDKGNLDPASASHLMQEVRCMKLVQHPNIVRLYEVIDTHSKLFLILELGDYDMHDFIAKHEKGCPEKAAQQYFSQIITAINYCHKLHVVHRDLKPENVVFFERLGMVKLTDFGFSNLFEPGEQLRTSCGSLAYSAPEILLGDAYDAPAVDVWSLGVILFMLVSGRLPFQETNDSETLTKILDCRYSMPEGLSQACKNLIARMLVRDPPKRASLEEISASPWVMAGDRGHADVLPLIVRHHLPDSAHTTIVEQMVNGGVGSEDDIIGALENGEYNYLSATYYLLAERVLASYREQAARSLVEHPPADIPEEGPLPEGGDAPSSRPSSSSRCRSRSNSFRASLRRPCTILKEESEEELSTYLRSSRHSSRFFLSRENSSSSSMDLGLAYGEGEDTVAGGGGGTTVPRPVSTDHLSVLRSTSSAFDECLSPIAEGVERKESSVENALEEEGGNGRLEIDMDLSIDTTPPLLSHDLRELRSESLPFARIGSGRRKGSTRLVRRNSSPSVSMFGGGGGMSSRDRVSPHALQELLEMTSLRGRRAASPDSIRSSRSPSPPMSSASGRTSPASSMLGRLKAPPPTGGTGTGIRKLSSSPHLLGICEEGEEDSVGSFLNSGGGSGGEGGVARTNRSASTTGVTFSLMPSVTSPRPPSAGSLMFTAPSPKTSVASSSTTSNPLSPCSPPTLRSASGSASSSPFPLRLPLTGQTVPRVFGGADPKGMATYSSVRMIRPRQAVVSPDVCRRYEKPRFIARSRRSTSCSSSETSDDDERRLTMLSTKYCRGGDGARKDDDDDGGTNGHDGTASGRPRGGAGGGPLGGGRGGKEAEAPPRGGPAGDGQTVSCVDAPVLSSPLLPIPEMTHLGTEKKVRIRARLLSRSATAERVVAQWAHVPVGGMAATPSPFTHYGSPPRGGGGRSDSPSTEASWVRCIARTKSAEFLVGGGEYDDVWASPLQTTDSISGGELSLSPSASSSLSSLLFSPDDDEATTTDSGLSLQRKKKYTKRRRNNEKHASLESSPPPATITSTKAETNHVQEWINRLQPIES